MVYRMTETSVLRASDFDAWREKLLASIKKHKGVTKHVAQDVNVGYSTVKRWIEEDTVLLHEVELQRARALQGGKPEKATPPPKPQAPARRRRRVA